MGGPKRDEVTGQWRKLHKEELNGLYCSPQQYWNEKNEMGGACSAYEERRDVDRVLVGKREGKRSLGDPGVDGRIILLWIFRKWDVGTWTGSSWFRIGKVGGPL